jgi:hypothetical protein
MKSQRLFILILVCIPLVLAGCVAPADKENRNSQRPRIEPPQQVQNSLRLIIYRPQSIVGMMGRPVIVINGQKMLTVLNDSMLEPGSVFVIDAPSEQTKLTWVQSGKTESTVEPLLLKGLRGAQRYFRWTLRPTYGYLEQVDESVAREEIGPLIYMGYKNVVEVK